MKPTESTRTAGQYASRAGELDQSSRAKNVTADAQSNGANPATSGFVVSASGRSSPRRRAARLSERS